LRVYLVIAGISQILSRRVNARHSLMFGCLAQALSVVVFAEAIQIHSLALASAGMVIAGLCLRGYFCRQCHLGEPDFTEGQPCETDFTVLRNRLYRQLGSDPAGGGYRPCQPASGGQSVISGQCRGLLIFELHGDPRGLPALIPAEFQVVRRQREIRRVAEQRF
jgi:hypothetical protein